jgi:geranylgeranyl diphosphate synthase type II
MIAHYTRQIEEELIQLHVPTEPANLYQPVRYFLALGGKRLRPALCLLACEMFSDQTQSAIGAAVGIELFHNFTLIHDDIMDEAPLRRGMETVHRKWNRDIAILSGDTTFVLALEQVMRSQADQIPALMEMFLKTARQVCEGQQLDMDFQTQDNVNILQYTEMIRLKTAVLLGCSLHMGAICGGASQQDAQLCYTFGQDLGVAFQMRDDLLDAFGNPEKFGKQVGGDILAGKKTFLLLKAYELASPEDRQNLDNWMYGNNIPNDERVRGVLDIYRKYHIDSLVNDEAVSWFNRGMNALERVSVPGHKKQSLVTMARQLMDRDH